MARHSLREILVMVLTVCGALAIFSLIATRLFHLTSQGTTAGAGGFSFSLGGVSAILFSALIIAVVAIGVVLAVALRHKR